VFLAHGLPKLNPGSPVGDVSGVAGFFKQIGVPLPAFFAWVVALLETIRAVLLVLGLGTRLLALAFALDMLVVIWLVRIRMGKSPFAGGQGIGWEFEFALLAGSLALLFTGAGSLALDPRLGCSQSHLFH
jgi:putative oxidoreductase